MTEASRRCSPQTVIFMINCRTELQV